MDADTLRGEGDRLRDARAWARAAAAYAAHLALRPDARDIRVQLGHCLKESGDVEAALEQYRAAEAAAPGDADIAVQIGHALKLLGRTGEAASAYDQALLRDTSRPDAAAELAALLGALAVPEAAVLVLGHASPELVRELPGAAFAAWDATAARLRWLPPGLAVHHAATGAAPPASATARPRLAQGGVILLAGPLPATALAALAPLADACAARVALLAAPGWTARGYSVARLLSAIEGSGDPAVLVEAARTAPPLPPLPAPRPGHAVTLGTGPVPRAAPEHGLGLLAPRSGAWGEAAPEGRRLRAGAEWVRVAHPAAAPLRMLVHISDKA
ncbi:MAG: hypothetical protein ACK4PG_18240, partial [Acetobacteraceae bacterium]